MNHQNRNLQAFAQLSKNITVIDLYNDFIETYDINRSLREVQYDWQVKLGKLDLVLEDQIALVQKNGETVGYLNALDIYEPIVFLMLAGNTEKFATSYFRNLVHVYARGHLDGIIAPGSEAGKES